MPKAVAGGSPTPGVALLALPDRAQNAVEAGFVRLRRLHTGQVGDYVAWLTLGVSVVGGLLALTLG